jgi:regulatory protein
MEATIGAFGSCGDTDPSPAKPENRALVSAAVAILARRELSSVALVSRLIKKEFSREESEIVAAWCESRGFLNEQRHAEGVANRVKHRLGSWRVGMQLKQKGASEEAIQTTLAALKPTEIARARSLIERRFGDAPADAGERARQGRFLRQRGFSTDVIRAAFLREAIA